jgi:hypothetical protein
MTKIRKGQAPAQLSRVQFHDRFTLSFKDPLFAPEEAALARVENVGWKAYTDSRKAPVTPTSTSGKNVAKAKALELNGWSYPKHLAGRVYGVVVHGDVAGIEGVRHALSDWLDWMGLVDAGPEARLDRYIGYYDPYATSHDALDRDKDVQEEVRNVARAVVNAVREARAGRLSAPDAKLDSPRPK